MCACVCLSVHMCTHMHTFPRLPVSVSFLPALYMSMCMYMMCVYYNSSTPKRLSMHTEVTVIKACQTDGREVRGNVSGAENKEMRWQSQAVLRCPGAAPNRGRRSCPPHKASLFFDRPQSKWQISQLISASLPSHTPALPA